MEIPDSKKKRSKFKWLKRAAAILGVLLLVPTLLFTIGWFNRDLLIDELQDWYRENNNGSLEIGKVDATFVKGFPNVGFTIQNIYQTSFDTILDKRTAIFIKNTQVTISATDLLTGNIRFRNIEIDQASIKTEVESDKSLLNYILLKKKRQSNATSGLVLPPWIHPERTNFRLKDVKFVSRDTMLNKYFNLEIHLANGKIRTQNEQVTGNLNFKVTVNDLGFNTKKGSYINGALVSGNPEFRLNQQSNILNVPEFPLKIDQQTFSTSAAFDFNKINSYSFNLSNPETDFQELKALLPQSLSVKLAPYSVLNPIETNLELSGEFKYGDTPVVQGEFSTEKNRISINDSLEVNDVFFNGYLTNLIYTDEDGNYKQPGKKDIKIFFEELSGKLQDLNIDATSSYYQTTAEALNFIEGRLRMSGSNETLARIMQTSNFDFIGGDFSLDTHISGDISEPEQVFDYATGDFSIENTRVVLQKNNLQLPVEILDINLDHQNSTLEKLKINLPNGEHLIFSGKVKNISSLLMDQPEDPAIVEVSLNSEELNINQLINTAMEFIPETEKQQNRTTTLHETVATIYHKFQPSFSLSLKSVVYDSIRLRDLTADIQLTNSETIKLNKLGFNYNNAFTELQGSLKIPGTKEKYREPLFIDVEANTSGPLQVFQDLFKIKLLEINSGEFDFKGKVTGNIQKFEQLLNNAHGDLKLKNARLYYPLADLNIELDSMKVGVHNAEIVLDRFQIEIDDNHPIAIQGSITEFPGFLLDNLKSKGRVKLGVESTFIDLDQWMETMHSLEKDSASKPIKNRELAVIFADIHQFDPEFILKVDSLKYQDLLSEDISARVYFENDSILKLDDLSIRYKNSKAVIKGMLSAHHLLESAADQNPFNFRFSAEASGKSKDLNELLKTVNFNLTSGDFEFTGSYEGEARDLKVLNSEVRGDLRLDTTMVDITAIDIQVPVDRLHLEIENNLATLDLLEVNLPGKSSISITGEIDNFSNFVNNTQESNSHQSRFTIRSPHLDSKDVEEFIGIRSREKDSTGKKKFEIKSLKKILRNLNNSYFPSASIAIDSLVHKKLAVSNFTSEIGFNDSGAIRIEDTKLKYHDGSIALLLQAGVASPVGLPMKIDMEIEDIDLGELVKDLDYFNYKELKETEKIEGNLNLDLDLTGVFDREGNLKMNTLNGFVTVELLEMAIYDFKPIIENVKLFSEERFEKLQFRPVTQTFKVVDGIIEIPRTQVQSTALQLFIEGQMKIGEYINIWISLPWNNIFKSRDGDELPQKVSFENSGAKFYLQLVQDKNHTKEKKRKLKTKFRLGNRKLEKSRKD
ncbi:AsmA-like C-terminal region-containing protein [Christiangramia sabulilitoris]|uniref:Uncharacterized protein n=1 Tax=Christiangramia sabulilitoris TaxID=2583991 RepID=A0A550I7N2_9FLAO|nr:AsmA-like C-terminal region-containing protein [Christiangramia sabulilitoris]TRO66980.1 hypothetical protein FGM01_03565 [Christiangramia sabulilitoris]